MIHNATSRVHDVIYHVTILFITPPFSRLYSFVKNFNMFYLGEDRYVSSSILQDKEYLHIRCYVKYANSQKLYPTAKGIALPLMRFRVLCDRRNVINPNEDDEFHIGGNVYVTVNTLYRTVDIRQFFMLDGKLQATKKGITLRMGEWNKLRSFMEKAEEYIPSLSQVIPCYLENSHNNQIGMYECAECFPDGFDY